MRPQRSRPVRHVAVPDICVMFGPSGTVGAQTPRADTAG